MKNTLFIFLLFVIIVGNISCGKDQLERRLDGKWIEATPCYNSTCDTLIMSKDGSFDSYYSRGATYIKIDDYALEVTRNDGLVQDYRIKLSDDYETLTIYCFLHNFQGECAVDMTFTKIE
jgi:hypothetical protein